MVTFYFFGDVAKMTLWLLFVALLISLTASITFTMYCTGTVLSERSTTVIADFSIDEVSELGFIGGSLVNEVLELFVDVNRDGLLGHGLTAARRQHELDSVWGDQSRGQHEENQQQEHQVRHGRGVERRFDLIS